MVLDWPEDISIVGDDRPISKDCVVGVVVPPGGSVGADRAVELAVTVERPLNVAGEPDEELMALEIVLDPAAAALVPPDCEGESVPLRPLEVLPV